MLVDNRISLVCAFVRGRLGLHFNEFVSRVRSVDNDKGTLRVVWIIQPTELEQKAFEDAWEDQNELAENVQHTIDSCWKCHGGIAA